MGGRTEGNGHANSWKILIGLSVLCAALVFLGGFLHRRALDSAIAERQARSVAFVNVKVADAIHGVGLDKPLKDADAAKLTKKLGVPAGTDVRLFSTGGVPLYGTPGSRRSPRTPKGSRRLPPATRAASSTDPTCVCTRPSGARARSRWRSRP